MLGSTVLGRVALLGVVVVAAVALPARAQVVRESGTRSVAGVLTGSWDEFTFESRGGEILFADVDSDVYQTQGRVEADHDVEGLAGSPGGDPVEGNGEHEEGDGCEAEGGPGRLCLQVVDSTDEVLCYAVRPDRPGWQRDPRLACHLPETNGAPETYRLRIAVPLHGEGCGQAEAYGTPTEAIPYLINVTLRTVAREGSLSRALGISTSRF